MSMLKKTDGLLTVRDAANRARVPEWKILQLAWRKMIFVQHDGTGFLLSPAAVQELPRLCKQHFSRSGEFLANPPTVAEYRARQIDGVHSKHARTII